MIKKGSTEPFTKRHLVIETIQTNPVNFNTHTEYTQNTKQAVRISSRRLLGVRNLNNALSGTILVVSSRCYLHDLFDALHLPYGVSFNGIQFGLSNGSIEQINWIALFWWKSVNLICSVFRSSKLKSPITINCRSNRVFPPKNCFYDEKLDVFSEVFSQIIRLKRSGKCSTLKLLVLCQFNRR